MKKTTGKFALIMVFMLTLSMMFASLGVFATGEEPAQGTQNQQQGNDNQNQQLGIMANQNVSIKVTFENTMGVLTIGDGTSSRGIDVQEKNRQVESTVQLDGGKAKYSIQISTLPGQPMPYSVDVNGTSHELDPSKDLQEPFEVDAGNSYVVVVHAREDGPVMHTIIWGNPGATDIDARDALIGHGNARVMAVYDQNDKIVPEDEYNFGHPGGVENGNGYVKAYAGWKVVFEFVPEYGYQLTSVAANEQPLDPQETTNQYTFIMPDTNVHFAATFTRTDDVVNTGTASVRGGTVNVANNLNGGTARLTVNDADLSADKIRGFQNAAGAYSVSQYLDIDLYNVFYKGKNDASDVWSNEIDELQEDATISLRLADGVNADDIVLVHNIHDGENFEIIPIDSYDPATNTITFKTRSFSNYAIATKDSKKGGSKGVNTGDDNNIIPDLVIMITAGLALAGMGLKRRYDR